MVCRGVDDGVVVRVEHVSKKYCKSLKHSMFYGLGDIGRNLLGWSSCSGRLRSREFWAVDDVSFELRRGETLGLIGPNGSGKSTLLKMLNGIFWPDRGRISVRGRVGALIEVGAGFHPLLTGRENVYVNSAILGMNKKEVDERFNDIIAFADIGDFIDAPIKTYSSGMFVRLGFAVAVHSNPDILLVDEVLSVGDITFTNKCMRKIGALQKNGTAIVFVSHSIPEVQRISQKVVFLNKGRVVCNSNANEAIRHYYSKISAEATVDKESVHKNAQGVDLAQLLIMDSNGKPTDTFETGQKIIIKCRFEVERPIFNPVFHISLVGDTYHSYRTKEDDIQISRLDSQTEIVLTINFFGLSDGAYHMSVALWDNNGIFPYYWDWDARLINVRSKTHPLGRFTFEHKWEIIQNK